MSAVRLEPGIVARIATGDRDASRIAADWLLEHGDERGEFILDELTVEARANPSTRAAAKARRAAWERTHFGAWASPLLALGATGYVFRRGFVDEVRLPEKALAALPRMLELEPISRLRVDLDGSGELALAMKQPSFDRIRGLDLDGAPRLERHERLESLVLRTAVASTIERVVACFPALSTLGVAFTEAGDAALLALMNQQLPLKRLWARRARVGDASLGALARTECALEELDLSSHDFDRQRLKQLGASTTLRKLHTLVLTSVRDARDFLSRDGLPALRHLRVTRPTNADRRLFVTRGISLH